MGSSQTKEEVIIAQAGNSGNAKGQTHFSIMDVGFFTVAAVVLVIILLFCYGKCKKKLERKIREEISRSREEV